MALDPLSATKVMAALFRVLEVETGFDRQALLGQRRDRPVIVARHVAWWVVRDLLPGVSASWIAGQFKRDHTTISECYHVKARALTECDRAVLYQAVLIKTVAIVSGRDPMPLRPDPAKAQSAPTQAAKSEVAAPRPGDVLTGGYIARDGAIICLP